MDAHRDSCRHCDRLLSEGDVHSGGLDVVIIDGKVDISLVVGYSLMVLMLLDI